MNRVDEMIDIIRSMSGPYSEYQVFSDWIRCMAIGIQNSCCMIHDRLWKQREEDYLQIFNRHKNNRFPELTGLLQMELEENITDVLSDIYMKGKMGAKMTGQFFTPFHLSYLTAKLGFDPDSCDEKGIYHMNEPSIGGGGMVIALARVMHEQGIDYQRRLKYPFGNETGEHFDTEDIRV